MTVIELPCLAARAFVLSRLDRHEEALAVADEQLEKAERMDSPAAAALARHDAGLISLAAGRHHEAAQLLEQALAEGAEVSRPAARLAHAEALARSGGPQEAARAVRQAALEPVRSGDQPWALVPGMARVQGLIALAQGDRAQARRRLSEAAGAWQRHLRHDAGAAFLANFVDLGPHQSPAWSSPNGNCGGSPPSLPSWTSSRRYRDARVRVERRMPRARGGGLETAVRPSPVPGMVGRHRDCPPGCAR
jgi:hypothetical protein